MAMSISAVANGTERKTSNDYRASGRKTKRKAVAHMAKTKHSSTKKRGNGGKRGQLKKNWAKMDLR